MGYRFKILHFNHNHDFASSMSDKIIGNQQKLSDVVGHKIPFIPCQVHQLNTFVEHSCSTSVIIGDLFSCFEQLYVFSLKVLNDMHA